MRLSHRDKNEGKELSEEEKNDPEPENLSTNADTTSEQIIIQSLKQEWPNITYVSEEESDLPEGHSSSKINIDTHVIPSSRESNSYKILQQAVDDRWMAKATSVCVFIDPLDGTRDFTTYIQHLKKDQTPHKENLRGNGSSTMVMIGIAVNGRATAGVLYQPFSGLDAITSDLIVDNDGGRTIWGMQGLGVFGLRKSLIHPKRKFTVATSLHHSTHKSSQAIERLGDVDVLPVGGAGFKTLLLLEGFVDAFVFATKGTKRWDTCAPEAIIECGGGAMTDAMGRAFHYQKENNVEKYGNSDGVVACMNPTTHRRIIKDIGYSRPIS
eukprot:TRINITY_DN5121_c0_g1_i1.p1 TRINITY_DN5121_c0_g1~~TRINITY_DN5121_c0_g1_i1.p1  ORF type:complete len:325 (-),score=46.01 TRINITY_DN5121_c0_g1_i1:68-1042(-)